LILEHRFRFQHQVHILARQQCGKPLHASIAIDRERGHAILFWVCANYCPRCICFNKDLQANGYSPLKVHPIHQGSPTPTPGPADFFPKTARVVPPPERDLLSGDASEGEVQCPAF